MSELKIDGQEPDDILDSDTMPHDSSGQWVGCIKSNNFDTLSSIYENLNNCNLYELLRCIVTFCLISYYGNNYDALFFIESGGSGFKTIDNFKKAIKWGTSEQDGVNNFGFGYKCECMIKDKQNYLVLKFDTSIPCGISWVNNRLGSMPRMTRISKIQMDFLMEKYGKNTRGTIVLWGETADRLLYNDDIKELLSQDISVHQNTELIYSFLNRRYVTKNYIEFNGMSLSNNKMFIKDRAKEHNFISGKKMLDSLYLELYSNGNIRVINYYDTQNFHIDFPSKGYYITDNGLVKNKPSELGNLVNSLTFKIINIEGDHGKRIHIKLNDKDGSENDIFIAEQDNNQWPPEYWPKIHIELSSKNPEGWLDLQPNKSRSRIIDSFLYKISKFIQHYYLDGKKPDISPAFHDIKLWVKKGIISTSVKKVSNKQMKEFQIENGIIRVDGQMKCPLCRRLIYENTKKGESKGPISHGHIKSEYDLRKEKSDTNGTEIENIIPICVPCNSSMGTTHMTQYVKESWGEDSDTYLNYTSFCEKYYKIYTI